MDIGHQIGWGGRVMKGWVREGTKAFFLTRPFSTGASSMVHVWDGHSHTSLWPTVLPCPEGLLTCMYQAVTSQAQIYEVPVCRHWLPQTGFLPEHPPGSSDPSSGSICVSSDFACVSRVETPPNQGFQRAEKDPRLTQSCLL